LKQETLTPLATHPSVDFTEAPADVLGILREAALLLPRQGPIKDFIALNPLHGFQEEPFERALTRSSVLFGAKKRLPWAFYQEQYAQGGLEKRELERVARLRGVDSETVERIDRILSSKETVKDEDPPLGWVANGIKKRFSKTSRVETDLLAPPVLFRLLSAYLDQGIGIRPFPSQKSFYFAVGELVESSFLPLKPLTDSSILPLFRLSPLQAIETALQRLVGSRSLYKRYLFETVLSHTGWYSMVNHIEKTPDTLRVQRAISLVEAVAVELLIELGWFIRKKGAQFPSLAEKLGSEYLPPHEDEPFDSLKRICHEAFEWTHYASVLKALQTRALEPMKPRSAPSIQAFFCIDDRECSLRRYLEEQDAGIATFGTPGFFGVDFLFQGMEDIAPVKQCPLPVTPRHLVREIPTAHSKRNKTRISHARHLDFRSNTLFGGWFTTQFIGLWSAVKLVLSIVKPTLAQPTLSSLSRIDATNDLKLFREGDQKDERGYYLGYSVPEMVERVFNVLAKSGLRSDFAELVFIVGHGSSSTNNPHFAAYDCGACSGRAGAPNARAFAMMANDLRVRDGLTKLGLTIPTSTRFIGAIHDTARDETDFFDCGQLSPNQETLFKRFQLSVKTAGALNAKERCRRFEMVPLSISPPKAMAEVKKRSSALFEPRPEFTHTNNAMTLVGTRRWTRGLYLDRRAFM
jgi:uncharacterized protein